MSILTFMEYPGGAAPPLEQTEAVIRFAVIEERWIKPKYYGSGEADRPVPKEKGNELVEFLVDFFQSEHSLTLREKTGLQFILAPPRPTLPAGTITWIAPASHPAINRSAHVPAVWRLMGLIHAPLAEAMSDQERDAFTYRFVEHSGYEERVRTVRGTRWGLRHAFWRMWFGAPYLPFFGKGRLASAPAFFKQPLDSEGYFFEVYEDPDEWSSPEALAASAKFQQHLGKKAFYSPESPDDVLETPEFQEV
jgi:hypothetical protein